MYKYFFFIYWNIVDVQYSVSFKCTAKWLDICIHYEVITTISLVTICPHTKLLQYYWPHFSCYILPPHGLLFYNWRLVPLNPLHLFCHTPIPFPLALTHLFSVSVSLSFFVLFYFSDSTCKWDHMVFVHTPYCFL